MTGQPITQADLKPCPFCGCLASINHSSSVFANHRDGRGSQGWRIECEGACHSMTCWWHSKPEAIAAWNHRAAPSAELVEQCADFVRNWNGQTSDGSTELIADAMVKALASGASEGRKPDVEAFAEAILHGDNQHRSWLKEAAQCWIAGKPLPEPYPSTQPSEGLAGELGALIADHCEAMEEDWPATAPEELACFVAANSNTIIAALSQQDAMREALEWWSAQATAWMNSRTPTAIPGWMKPAIEKTRQALGDAKEVG